MLSYDAFDRSTSGSSAKSREPLMTFDPVAMSIVSRLFQNGLPLCQPGDLEQSHPNGCQTNENIHNPEQTIQEGTQPSSATVSEKLFESTALAPSLTGHPGLYPFGFPSPKSPGLNHPALFPALGFPIAQPSLLSNMFVENVPTVTSNPPGLTETSPNDDSQLGINMISKFPSSKVPSMNDILSIIYAAGCPVSKLPDLDYADTMITNCGGQSGVITSDSTFVQRPVQHSKLNNEDFCELCQKHFCNKYYLRKHKSDVHGIHSEPYSHTRRRDPGVSNADSTFATSSMHTNEPLNSFSQITSTEQPAEDLSKNLTSPVQDGTDFKPEASQLNECVESSMSTQSFGSDTIPGDVHAAYGLTQAVHSTPSKNPHTQSSIEKFASPTNGFLHFPPSKYPPTNPVNGIIADTDYSIGSADISSSVDNKKIGSMSLLACPGLPLDFDMDGVSCDECHKVFCNKYFLNIHKLQNHLIPTSKVDPGAQSDTSNRTEGQSSEQMPQPTDFTVNGLKHSVPFYNDIMYGGRKNELRTSRPSASSSSRMIGQTVSKSSATPLDAFKNSMVAAKLADRVTCELCKKELCNKYFLRTHKIRVHGIAPKDVGGPPMRNPPSMTTATRHTAPNSLVTAQQRSSRPSSPTNAGMIVNPNYTSVIAESLGTYPLDGRVNHGSLEPETATKFTANTSASSSNKISTQQNLRTEYLTNTASGMEPANRSMDLPDLSSMSNIISCPICDQAIGPRLFLPSHLSDSHGLNPIHPAFFLTMLRAKAVEKPLEFGFLAKFGLDSNDAVASRANELSNDLVAHPNHSSSSTQSESRGIMVGADCPGKQCAEQTESTGDVQTSTPPQSATMEPNTSLYDQVGLPPFACGASTGSGNEVSTVTQSHQPPWCRSPRESDCASIMSPYPNRFGATITPFTRGSIIPGLTGLGPLAPIIQDTPYNSVLCSNAPFKHSPTLQMNTLSRATSALMAQNPSMLTNCGLPRKSPNQMRVLCDICNKWICNKYFLRTHKANKHGISDSSQQQQQQHQLPTEPIKSFRTSSTSSSSVNHVSPSSTPGRRATGAVGGPMNADLSGSGDNTDKLSLINPASMNGDHISGYDQFSMAWKAAQEAGFHAFMPPHAMSMEKSITPFSLQMAMNPFSMSHLDATEPGFLSSSASYMSMGYPLMIPPGTQPPLGTLTDKLYNESGGLHAESILGTQPISDRDEKFPLNLSLKCSIEPDPPNTENRSVGNKRGCRRVTAAPRRKWIRKLLDKAKRFKSAKCSSQTTGVRFCSAVQKRLDGFPRQSSTRKPKHSTNRNESTSLTKPPESTEFWTKTFPCPLCPSQNSIGFTTVNMLAQHLSLAHDCSTYGSTSDGVTPAEANIPRRADSAPMFHVTEHRDGTSVDSNMWFPEKTNAFPVGMDVQPNIQTAK